MTYRLVTGLVPLALGLSCTPVGDGVDRPGSDGFQPDLICFAADGTQSVVSFDEPGSAMVALGTGARGNFTSLEAAPTGSGYLYTADTVELRGQGDEATLTMNGMGFACATPG